MKPPKHILPVIVISQFLCTSLWFAGNGVMQDLIATFDLTANALGHLTSAVQFGFISGTLVFAMLTITDRFSPSKVFFLSALLAALFNLAVIWQGHTLTSILILRYITGFFLAGIYPVGMKIAADYFDKGLGKSLGFLVGALVIGTALPHVFKSFSFFSWKSVLISTSALASSGGVLMLALVPNGPYRKISQQLHLTACFSIFKKKGLRAAAFGYFGHMWELYTFWAFVPIMLTTYASMHGSDFNVPLLSFSIIAIGGLACVLGGFLSQKLGVKKTATLALSLSGLCCLISPLLFMAGPPAIFIGFLLLWGMVVIADSPLFSTLVAQNADATIKGSALTIVNCIGFAITILSIQMMTFLQNTSLSYWHYMLLALGPIFGLVALCRK